MTPQRLLHELSSSQRLNFLLTNRIPRRWATLFIGRFSRIRHPLVRRPSIAVWQLFAGDLRLDEALQSRFASMQDCFIRELKPGARPIDANPEVMVSPCDGIVGAHGAISGTRVFQAKGFPYALEDLLGDAETAERYRDGVFVTLRLKANMYHRFHAPDGCRLNAITYISGDTWNVNPIALARVERLYCRNERAAFSLDLACSARPVMLVAVAAILVASIRIRGFDATLGLTYRGPNRLHCAQAFERGQEMGYFQQGSTIVVIAPAGFALADTIQPGHTMRMGQSLLTKPRSPT